MDATLTVITVCIEKHFDYVKMQRDLIVALNPELNFELLVVDNTSDVSASFVSEDPRVTVMPGVAPDMSHPPNFRGSYHHATALNLAVSRAKTPYVLILDPDCFVVYRNWFAEICGHMIRHELSFFGVPWHYRWYAKYRYFPCIHFLLIDTARVTVSDLDFTPSISAAPKSDRWFDFLLKPFPYFHSRTRINSSRDTGWRLSHVLAKRGHRAGTTLPVTSIDDDFVAPSFLRSAKAKIWERRWPRAMSFLPALGTYVEPAQAPGFRHPGLRQLAPETFVWRGQPFAFHLRRHVRDTVDKKGDHKAELQILQPLLDEFKARQSWTWLTR